MFPNSIIAGIHLYEILLVLGIVAAFVLFRILSNKIDITNNDIRYYFTVSGISVIAGILGAILFQDIYNFIKTGNYVFSSGMTFLGGLTSAIITFLLVFHFTASKETKNTFPRFLRLAPICIAFAHGIGRIGCLMAGCCYGKPTDSFIGISFKENSDAFMVYGGQPLIPTQLFEAIFLFILGTILINLLLKKKSNFNVPIYCISYGIFRFTLEFFRGDERGGIENFLSPSQILSILLIILGICYIIFHKKKMTEEVI